MTEERYHIESGYESDTCDCCGAPLRADGTCPNERVDESDSEEED